MKSQLSTAVMCFIAVVIESQVVRRWSPEELINKAVDDNPRDSYFISDPNQYFEGGEISSLKDDLKQIYIQFHFNVFAFVFPQMIAEYSSLDGDEGIDRFTNETLGLFLGKTDFSREKIIIIVYPIENEVIRMIGGKDVMKVYSDEDLLSILKRQLDNFRNEKLAVSFHNIFEEIAYDSPHSIVMKVKYFIWRFQSLSIGLVAGLLFLLKISLKKPKNEVLIDKMQMFVLQLKFQAKWKSHCMICLEKLPISVKKKDKKEEEDEDDDNDEEETEIHSKKKLRKDDDDEDNEEEEEEEDDEDEDEEQQEVEEVKKKEKKKKEKDRKSKWEECDSKEEEDEEDKCEYVDQLKLALSQFKQQAQGKSTSKSKAKGQKKVKPIKVEDISPALSIKIRKSLRQKGKDKKKPKKEEKPKPKPKQKTKPASKGHSRSNSKSQNDTSLFIKKPLKVDKAKEAQQKEEKKPFNIFKSKYTLEEQADPRNKEKITLDCNHSFHRRCFDEWHEIKHTSSCPVCDYNMFSNSNQTGDDSFKNKLVKLQEVFHPELKDMVVNL